MNRENTKCMILSSNCRKSSHEECPGAWDGLGIEVFCECWCHKKITENSSETRRTGSTVRPSSKNESLNVGVKNQPFCPWVKGLAAHPQEQKSWNQEVT